MGRWAARVKPHGERVGALKGRQVFLGRFSLGANAMWKPKGTERHPLWSFFHVEPMPCVVCEFFF